MVHHMICGLCFPLFLVCFVCIVEIFVPRVLSLQSLTLNTSVLPCGLSEQIHSRCRGGLGVAAASGEARSTQGLLEVWQGSQGLGRLGKLRRGQVVQSLQD